MSSDRHLGAGRGSGARKPSPTYPYLPPRRDRSSTIGAWLLVAVLVSAAWLAYNHDRTRYSDGFASYQPELSTFPQPPVADATTLVGTARPNGWPAAGPYCPSRYGDPWTTVRRDWGQDGAKRSWVISVCFSAIDPGDDSVESYRDWLGYRGWTYDRDWNASGDYAAIRVDLDGLPENSLAFQIDASPNNADRETGAFDPDQYEAYGVMLRGKEPGRVMMVFWIGWGVDVPTDQLVSTAQAWLDSANQALENEGEASESAGNATPKPLTFSETRE